MRSITCDSCGSEIRRFPSRIHETNFCSRSCQGEYRTRHLRGARASNWQGGTRVSGGRMQWYIPDHPRADGKGYVFRYVVIAEQKLGRELLPEEVVHHDDDDSMNDDPGNLVVFPSQSEHARYHGLKRSPEQMEAMRNARRKRGTGSAISEPIRSREAPVSHQRE